MVLNGHIFDLTLSLEKERYDNEQSNRVLNKMHGFKIYLENVTKGEPMSIKIKNSSTEMDIYDDGDVFFKHDRCSEHMLGSGDITESEREDLCRAYELLIGVSKSLEKRLRTI